MDGGTVMSRKKLLACFVGAALCSFGIAYPEVSHSADRRVPCLTYRGDDNSAALATSACAWDDSSFFRASSLTALNIHWYHPFADTGGVVAAGAYKSKACILYFAAEGGECGTQAQSPQVPGGPRAITLSPSRSVWTVANVAHFKFVTHGGQFGGDPDLLKGLFAAMP